MENFMTFPIDDAGFTLWHGDLDTQLKQLHGMTSREMGLERRWLAEHYYAGVSVATFIGQLPAIAKGASRP